MALINCPECGTQVSNQAPSCNKCAYPLNKISSPKMEPSPPKNISEKEKQIWKGSPSWIVFLGAYLLSGFLLIIGFFTLFVNPLYGIFSLLFGGFMWFLSSKELENWVIEITDQRIIVKRGWLNSKTEELELFRVKDIRLDEPFLLKSMGLATITLVTSDRTNKIQTIPAIQNGQALREKIRNAVDIRREVKKVREIDDSRTFPF